MKRRFLTLIFALFLISIVFSLTACNDCSHTNRRYSIKREPTYINEGEVYVICADCNMRLFTQVVYPLQQEQYYDVEVITAPTCTQNGYKKYTLTLNNDVFEFESDVPALPHLINGVYEAIDELRHKIFCDCGAYSTANHTFSSVITREPTCKEYGEEKIVCTDCTFEATVLVEKLSHNYEHTAKIEPTCTVAGSTEGLKCTLCGDVKAGIEEIGTVPCKYEDGKCVWCKQPKRITLTFVNGNSSETKTLTWGDTFINQAQTGDLFNVFLGWYSEDGNTKYDESIVLTDDLTVYAKWDKSIAIGTAEEFLSIWQAPDKSYYLTADINMRGEVLWGIEHFTGSLNGCGYTVKNFNVSTNELSDYQGLIQVNDGKITNIKIIDYTFNVNATNAASAKSGAAIGGLVGLNRGEISDVTVNTSSFSTAVAFRFYQNGGYSGNLLNIGGIVGINDGTLKNISLNFVYSVYVNSFNPVYGEAYSDRAVVYNIGKVCAVNNGTVADVYNHGNFTVDIELGTSDYNVSVSTYVGGVAGINNESGNITRSYFNGTLNYKKDSDTGWRESEHSTLGGFVGANYGTVELSYANGEVIGGSHSSCKLGGFVGLNDEKGKISSCYVETDIGIHTNGSNAVGGFAGRNDALIQSCYSKGTLCSSVGASVGGFVGINDAGGSISRSYSRVDIDAFSYRSGEFASDNVSIITKCYYLDNIHFNPGNSMDGEMSVTTDIKAINATDIYTEAFFTDTMYWNEEGWNVSTEGDPVLSWQSAVTT